MVVRARFFNAVDGVSGRVLVRDKCALLIYDVVIVKDGFESPFHVVFDVSFVVLYAESYIYLKQRTVIIARVLILLSFMCFLRRGRGLSQRRVQGVYRLSCHLFYRGRSVK